MSTNPNNLVPMPPRVWSDTPTPNRREKLWIAAGKVCYWCGKPTRYHPLNPDGSYNPLAWDMATIDHVIPRFKGGSDDESNMVSACRLCNNRRSHEDNCGFPDGALLGKFDPDKGMVPKRVQKKKAPPQSTMVALTGDEKKTITGKKTASDIHLEQRDQALKALGEIQKEMKHYVEVVKSQEEELKALKSMTVWELIRKRLAEWIFP